MKQTVKLFGALIIASSLFSCSKDDVTPSPTTEPTNIELIQGTWKETNLTHDGITSTTQIICDGERERYTFVNDNSFSERLRLFLNRGSLGKTSFGK